MMVTKSGLRRLEQHDPSSDEPADDDEVRKVTARTLEANQSLPREGIQKPEGKEVVPLSDTAG